MKIFATLLSLALAIRNIYGFNEFPYIIGIKDMCLRTESHSIYPAARYKTSQPLPTTRYRHHKITTEGTCGKIDISIEYATDSNSMIKLFELRRIWRHNGDKLEFVRYPGDLAKKHMSVEQVEKNKRYRTIAMAQGGNSDLRAYEVARSLAHNAVDVSRMLKYRIESVFDHKFEEFPEDDLQFKSISEKILYYAAKLTDFDYHDMKIGHGNVQVSVAVFDLLRGSLYVSSVGAIFVRVYDSTGNLRHFSHHPEDEGYVMSALGMASAVKAKEKKDSHSFFYSDKFLSIPEDLFADKHSYSMWLPKLKHNDIIIIGSRTLFIMLDKQNRNFVKETVNRYREKFGSGDYFAEEIMYDLPSLIMAETSKFDKSAYVDRAVIVSVVSK